MNADGFGDLAAASEATLTVGGNTFPQAGRITLFRLDATLTVTATDTITGPSPQPAARFGAALRIADLNDDGLADIAAGAPDAQVQGFPTAGAAAVFFGTPKTPFEDTYRTLVLTPPAPSSASRFGVSISLGDFTGNAVNDLATGQPLIFSNGIPLGGRVALFENLLRRRANPNLQGVVP